MLLRSVDGSIIVVLSSDYIDLYKQLSRHVQVRQGSSRLGIYDSNSIGACGVLALVC